MKIKKKTFQPVKNEKITPQLPKEKIKHWGKRRKLGLNSELDTVNQELKSSQHDVPNLLKPKSKRKRTLEKKPKKKPKPTILEVPEGKSKLDEELARVEGELLDISKVFPKTLNMKTRLPDTSGDSELEELERKKREKRLKKIQSKLKKAKNSPNSLLASLKPKRKSKKQRLADKKAISEVKKISRKIEGKHKVPPSELVQIEQEIAKLSRELKKRQN